VTARGNVTLAALELAAAGLPVLPVASGAKGPARCWRVLHDERLDATARHLLMVAPEVPHTGEWISPGGGGGPEGNPRSQPRSRCPTTPRPRKTRSHELLPEPRPILLLLRAR